MVPEEHYHSIVTEPGDRSSRLEYRDEYPALEENYEDDPPPSSIGVDESGVVHEVYYGDGREYSPEPVGKGAQNLALLLEGMVLFQSAGSRDGAVAPEVTEENSGVASANAGKMDEDETPSPAIEEVESGNPPGTGPTFPGGRGFSGFDRSV